MEERLPNAGLRFYLIFGLIWKEFESAGVLDNLWVLYGCSQRIENNFKYETK